MRRRQISTAAVAVLLRFAHLGERVPEAAGHEGAQDGPDRDAVPVARRERCQPDVLPNWQWTIQLHAGRFANSLRMVTALEGNAVTRDGCLAPFREPFERSL